MRWYQESGIAFGLGSVKVGKLADRVVIDRDYMTVTVYDIRHLMSILTMVDGRMVDEAL